MARLRAWRAALVWGCAPTIAAALFATPLAAQKPEDAQRRLDTSRQQLDERRREAQNLTADVTQLQAERERINQGLVDTARLIQRSEAQMTGMEARMGELETQEKQLRGSLIERHDSISRLLAAMQRMGRNPPPVLVTKREDALQMVRSAMMLAAAFPELRSQALSLTERLTTLGRVMDDIRSEGDKLRAETARLAESRTRLSQLMESKRQSLSERQGELERVRREAAEIAKNVTDLNELIAKLDKTVTAHVGPDLTAAAATTPPGDTSASAEGAASPAPTPPPASGPPPAKGKLATPNTPGAAASPPSVIEIAPKGSRPASFGRMHPAVPFAQTRGHLPLPAQGRRILAFGEKTQYGGQSKGMVLETRHSAQITSPSDGWVVFAGEFRTFGQLLIINAGDGYHILLAGLSQIDVQLGQFVLAGEPVGVMSGAPRSAKAKPAENAPVLYIEFRKDGRPIDPAPWWVPDGQHKVQG